jgi:hypothetical protein
LIQQVNKRNNNLIFCPSPTVFYFNFLKSKVESTSDLFSDRFGANPCTLLLPFHPSVCEYFARRRRPSLGTADLHLLQPQSILNNGLGAWPCIWLFLHATARHTNRENKATRVEDRYLPAVSKWDGSGGRTDGRRKNRSSYNIYHSKNKLPR